MSNQIFIDRYPGEDDQWEPTENSGRTVESHPLAVQGQTLPKNSCNSLIPATFVSKDILSSNKNSNRTIIL
jgi:hypothetical protein